MDLKLPTVMKKILRDLKFRKSAKTILIKTGKKIQKSMKLLSFVILLLNVFHPDWVANKFFGSSADQPGSTSITLSQQFSYEVITTSDTTIIAVKGFQKVNFSNKWASGTDQMFFLTKSENREGVRMKDLMENECPGREHVYYIIDADGNLDLYSLSKLNENSEWKIWRYFKYRVVGEGKKYHKYYRYYLINTSEKFNCGCNFYLSDEVGKLLNDYTGKPREIFEKHNLIREILFKRGSEKQNKYIYITCNKDKQVNVGNEALLVNENSQSKFNYSHYLEEYKKSNEKSDLIFSNTSKMLWPATSINNIFKIKIKDNYLLLDTRYEKCEDGVVIYILRFNKSVIASQVNWNYNTVRHEDASEMNINNACLVPIINLIPFFKIPKDSHSAQSWCYSKYRVRTNFQCMHDCLIECFYKSKKPKDVIMQG